MILYGLWRRFRARPGVELDSVPWTRVARVPQCCPGSAAGWSVSNRRLSSDVLSPVGGCRWEIAGGRSCGPARCPRLAVVEALAVVGARIGGGDQVAGGGVDGSSAEKHARLGDLNAAQALLDIAWPWLCGSCQPGGRSPLVSVVVTGCIASARRWRWGAGGGEHAAGGVDSDCEVVEDDRGAQADAGSGVVAAEQVGGQRRRHGRVEARDVVVLWQKAGRQVEPPTGGSVADGFDVAGRDVSDGINGVVNSRQHHPDVADRGGEVCRLARLAGVSTGGRPVRVLVGQPSGPQQ